MHGQSRRPRGLVIPLLVLSLAAACTGGADTGTTTDTMETVTVDPDLQKSPLTVNVLLTDTGFQPSIIFLPAGRQIQLVLRNRGTGEHHFRIQGLVPVRLAWLQIPEIDAYDLDTMTPQELASYGIDLTGVTDDYEIDHILHHLHGVYVPFREESPSGIKPIGIDVHGWVTLGKVDVVSFIAPTTGRYMSEDVLHPELTGEVVVFDPGR